MEVIKQHTEDFVGEHFAVHMPFQNTEATQCLSTKYAVQSKMLQDKAVSIEDVHAIPHAQVLYAI